jgi:hypothetical protein
MILEKLLKDKNYLKLRMNFCYMIKPQLRKIKFIIILALTKYIYNKTLYHFIVKHYIILKKIYANFLIYITGKS